MMDAGYLSAGLRLRWSALYCVLSVGAIGCDGSDQAFQDPTAGTDAVWEQTWQSLEAEMLTQVNLRRAAGAVCGVGDEAETFGPADPLEMNTQLQVAARLHSDDMARRDFFPMVRTPSCGWSVLAMPGPIHGARTYRLALRAPLKQWKG